MLLSKAIEISHCRGSEEGGSGRSHFSSLNKGLSVPSLNRISRPGKSLHGRVAAEFAAVSWSRCLRILDAEWGENAEVGSRCIGIGRWCRRESFPLAAGPETIQPDRRSCLSPVVSDFSVEQDGGRSMGRRVQ